MLSCGLLLTGCWDDEDEAPAQPVARAGVFLDSAVSGLNYFTSSRSGLTDGAGTFAYLDGEAVSFFVGPLLLGTAAGQPVVTPLTLVPAANGDINNDRVTNIAVLLQSLDSDRNPDNGINIPSAAAAAAQAHPVNLGLPAQQFQQSAELTALVRQANNDLRDPVTPEQAREHLRETTGGDPDPDATLQSITVSAPANVLLVGAAQQYSASGQFSDGTTQQPLSGVTWASTNPSTATISNTGEATALAAGVTTISASRDGKTGAAQLTVNLPPPPPAIFKVGVGSANHNPTSRVCIGGGSTNCGRAAGPDAIRDPLIARAAAITGVNDQTFIVITTTNIGYFLAYKPEVSGLNGIYDVRLRIAQITGVPSTNITVVSDHSHNGPDTIGIWGGVSAEYMKITADSVVAAAVQAFESRRDAHLRVAAVNSNVDRAASASDVRALDSSYDKSPGNNTDLGNPYNEFRMLVADAADGGERILTFVNYAPHATVTNGDRFDDQYRLTGDWPAWVDAEARTVFGEGMGIGIVGALGATDWNKVGDIPQKEAEARERLRKLMTAATASLQAVGGGEVAVKSTFIREAMTQPILLLNYKPAIDRNDPAVPSDGLDVRIDRSVLPPFLTGTVVGTYVSAARIGDVFLSTFPGEPFGELNHALRNENDGRVQGARAQFLLGGANDFFGYMVKNLDTYEQTLRTGFHYLPGCEDETNDLETALMIREEGEGACSDHWTLMVSPTIGSHIVCTLQNAADALGFTTANRDPECDVLTALDGLAGPPESDNPVLGPVLDARQSAIEQARDLAAQCPGTGAPAQLCLALAEGARQAEIYSGAEPAGGDVVPPANAARAGVASRDASWHLGASAGQFANSGAGIARDAGFDPYGHSTRKVGADILGTRIHTRALVVEGSNGQRVAVVADDLYLPNDLLQRRTAQKLAEHDRLVSLGLKQGTLTGITGANLAMTSSHSHTSPFYSTPSWGTWIFQDVFDLRFYEYMATQQAEAIIAAASNLKPVRMGGATVKSNDVTGHTYGPKGPPNDSRDGTPAGQPYEYTTQQVTVLSFDDITNPAQPAPLANWVIFGVHPEWVWGEEIVNGDITHATMRMLDRETGAMTVWSQRETGSSGPHKDTRVHQPQDRREFQESGPSGTDRGARLLTNSIKKALNDLKNNTKEIPAQFAAYQTNFPVTSVSQRFAPPATRPYPGVSNCNSDRVFEGDVGLPILGFPDCFYDHTEFTDVVAEPFMEALPYSPTDLRDQLIAAGVPIPVSYSATTLTAVEETAAVHLQVFKLGSVVAAMSPSEQFTSGALNLATRLDKVSNNLWHGFDWACRLPSDHAVRAGESAAVTRHCNAQNLAYPDLGRGIPGSVDGTPMAKVRAQIHNDAIGWELDPIYMFNQQDPTPLLTLGSESEPAEPADIKGNFTHEEFTGSGYDLVITVGMANDYWGYMPEYRDYRSFDHYRKALNGLGPHGADFLNTRLARMAAQLNGSSVALPTNPLDTFFQAESLRAEATAQMLGETARAYTALYDVTVPADGGTARVLNEPAMTVPRFSAAVMKFVGGSNYSGSPNVHVERLVSTNPDVWETYGTQDGEVQLQLQFLPSAISEAAELPVADEGAGFAFPEPQAYALWRAGMREWEWTATFEAFVSELDNLGARPRVTPAGQYRFVVDGDKRDIGGVLTPYHLESATFTVVPWNGITVEGLRVENDRRVSFAIGPVSDHRVFRDGMGTDAKQFTISDSEPSYVVGPVDYPDSYSDGISWITNERQLNVDGSRESGGHQQYCVRCSFRPWADAAEVVSATVTVHGAENATRTLPATRSGERWVTTGSLAEDEAASVEIGGIVDQYGETNGQAYVAGANRAPVAHAGADFSVVKDGVARLNGIRSNDPDRDAVTYVWFQIAGNEVVLSNPNALQPSFTAPAEPGTLIFLLTASDGRSSGSDEVTVTVTDGVTPPGPEPFDVCIPLGCLREDVPVIGAPLADALGVLLGEGVPAPPGGGSELPSSDGLLQTPLMPTEEASCAPDNSNARSYPYLKGSLHEHSGYSDGTVGTTPASYFAAGKSSGLAFMGSSEHSDNALIPLTVSDGCLAPEFPDCVTPLPSTDNPAAPVTKWDMTLQQAQAASTADFTAFRGFEWTSDRFGHINVYFSRNDFNAKTTEGYTASMESFYNWFKTTPAAGGGNDGLLVFNHPGREDTIEGSLPNTDPAYAFNDFQYRADVDLRAVGIEVFGKSSDAYDTDNNAPPGGWYAHALDKGWHLGPVGAEDEHGTEWGKPNRAKTVLIARDRSEGALREAMLARRFFALAQGHSDIGLNFFVGGFANGQMLGSRIAKAVGQTVTLDVELISSFGGTLELVTRGGEVIADSTVGNLHKTVVVTAEERWYFVRVKRNNRPVAYSAPIWIRGGGAYPVCGEWLAGDLHVHSTYSHDSYGGPDEVAGPLNETVPVTRDVMPGDNNTGPDEFYVYGHSVANQFRIAAQRGLDYLAITDHNDIRSHSDPGRGAMGLIHLPSYENSLSGHAQMHGARRIYEGGGSLAGVRAQADALRGDGGVFQINHPADKSAAPYPDNLGWSYGFDVVPDTIEVWNIGVRAYQAPFPSYTNNDGSTEFWEDFLNQGHKVGATGGSDNHWVTLTGVAGAGQPTTWVFARERSARGLLEGLKAGRTFISHQPPLMGGPRVVIEADTDGDGIYESAIGDTVLKAAALRARVYGAPGALVRIYSGSADFIESEMPLMTLDAAFDIVLPAGTEKWLRAEVLEPDGIGARNAATPLCEVFPALGETLATITQEQIEEDTGTTYCRNRLAVLAMTSAIYLAN